MGFDFTTPSLWALLSAVLAFASLILSVSLAARIGHIRRLKIKIWGWLVEFTSGDDSSVK